MKIKIFKKEFPLVALVLLIIGLSAGALSFNYSVKAVKVIQSKEALKFSYDDEPDSVSLGGAPSVKAPDGIELDYYFRSIPEPTPLYLFNEKNARYKEVPESVVYGENSKSGNWIGFIKVGDSFYKYDIDKTQLELDGQDFREIKKGRTAWLISYYGPKALGSLAIAVAAISTALALLASYKKGYITKRNVLLVKLSAIAVGVASLSFFLAKGLLLIGVFGSSVFGFPISDLLFGSIFPTLLVLAALVGLTHIVCQNMRNSISMKEEIDGTV